MATRKQRRRRAKERRHEWEYVLVDEQGREVPLEEEKARARDGAAGAGRAPAAVRAPGGRVIEPPSWGRVLKRAGLFGPLMLIVVYLLKPKGASLATVVVQTLVLLAFFIPFSYLMDALMYRMARKRAQRARAGDKGR